jgi:hypothetical protein
VWVMHKFSCSFSIALCIYVQYGSGHKIAILNSPVQKGECASSIHTWKVPCKWCTSHHIVLFCQLISIANLWAFVQNGKETCHNNSQTHRDTIWVCSTCIPSSQHCLNESSLSLDEWFLFLQHWVYMAHYGQAYCISELANTS